MKRLSDSDHAILAEIEADARDLADMTFCGRWTEAEKAEMAAWLADYIAAERDAVARTAEPEAAAEDDPCTST